MMTQDIFATLISSSEGRIGRICRSRMVVHSIGTNASFKAYYAGDLWIAETWDPIAFLFPLLDSNVTRIVPGLLSRSLNSQFEYVQEHFPNAVRLTSCSVLGVDEHLSEADVTTKVRDAAQLESTVSFMEFSGGFRIQSDAALMVLLYLGESSLPVRESEILVYCCDGALQNYNLQRILTDAKLSVLVDENCD